MFMNSFSWIVPEDAIAKMPSSQSLMMLFSMEAFSTSSMAIVTPIGMRWFSSILYPFIFLISFSSILPFFEEYRIMPPKFVFSRIFF